MFGEFQAFARELFIFSFLDTTDIAYLYWINLYYHLILPPQVQPIHLTIGLLTIVSTSAFVLFVYINLH